MGKNIYDEALELQDACNEGAIVRWLGRNINHLENQARIYNESLRDNAAFVSVIGKLASLCGIQDIGNEKEIRAYSECETRKND